MNSICRIITSPPFQPRNSYQLKLFVSSNMATKDPVYHTRQEHTPSESQPPSLQTYRGVANQLLMEEIIDSSVRSLFDCFKRNGYSLRLVGGVTRDLVLGITPNDIDMCTDALPDTMQLFLKQDGYKVFPTGIAHGTLTVLVNNRPIEVTTLRMDKVTDGRHAEVMFTDSWCLDAERRDFTVNAMSIDENGLLYDYFNGIEDLKERRLRFVLNARKRIQEDYLRILRYFRFHGKICKEGDSHIEDVLQAIRENVSNMSLLSVERVWLEVKKILAGNNAPSLVKLIYDLGVGKQINMPHSPCLKEFTRVWKTHFFGQFKLSPDVLMVALMEDTNEHGMGYFCSNWRMSNIEKKRAITLMLRRHAVTDTLSPEKYYKDMLVDGEKIENVVELMVYKEMAFSEVEKFKLWQVPSFPVTGHDIASKGFEGKAIGETKNKLFRLWKESYYLMSKEELLSFLNK